MSNLGVTILCVFEKLTFERNSLSATAQLHPDISDHVTPSFSVGTFEVKQTNVPSRYDKTKLH